MILGLGADLCDIRRIEASLLRFGDRLTHRLFSADERARAERGQQQPAALAEDGGFSGCEEALHGQGHRDIRNRA